ncbi:hypothetical protein GCM10027267_19800 [Paramicrobacterium agarici]
MFRHQEDGTLKITGTLSPEQAAQVTPVFDAYMSKRTSPTFMHADEQADNQEAPEERSKPQERTDVFTTIIGGTGKQKTAPKLHGRGPTVLVTVDARNLNEETGGSVVTRDTGAATDEIRAANAMRRRHENSHHRRARGSA